MSMRRFLLRWLPLSILLIAVAAQAEVIPFDLEVGYRWLKLDGSENMYRTQINERSGFLIRTFSLNTSDVNGGIDRLRIDASDLGVGPAGALRLEATRADTYRFTLGYRQTNAFSALPAFANPLLGQGIVPGQHTYDRDRKMLDLDFEYLAAGKFTPFIGYSFNRVDGPGTTTFALGGDEFLLSRNLKDTANEFRVGTGFNLGSVQGSITQGWRRQHGTDSLTLAGAANGNSPGPILGQPLSATSITRSDKTNVKTPFTNAYVTGQFAKRVRLIGNYVRFAATSDGNDTESAAGSFVSFPISRFFTGLSEQASSRAKNSTWRGGGRAEINLFEGVDLLAGYQREHRELDGSALINTLYLNSITFGGIDKRDLQTVLNASNSLERTETVTSAGFSARALEPFSIRAEYREAKQEVTVTPDLSELVVPSSGGEGGSFNRKVRTFDTNAAYTQSGFTLGAAWRRDQANTPIFRTDFLDRYRFRVRAAWAAPKYFRAGITAENTKQRNDQTGINFDSRIRQYSGDVEVTPVQAFRLYGSFSKFKADSNLLYRIPQNFTTGTSIHAENGRSREGGFSVFVKKVTLDAGLSKFNNEGTIPFNMDRYRVRAVFDIHAKTGVAAEYGRDKYSEASAALSNYRASRYGLYFRWTP